ncbi:MAG: YidC/Oxa1 family membrane protein insertase [Candidatus Spechtbacteria bacterium SB0662_bin_43]|uniref:YidC/Oxa1 family membrane protein insertase n=1 Tax=Candidatus Spechtbacteria bacterium SB0662_bin_43 TaxID=2604897 RepID=A0A845DAD9_9BACT|nr:YidC/Oxa1 family membrane protein insertase [Candidatus Spechtbacteria bacterium SB0662_bin_43]
MWDFIVSVFDLFIFEPLLNFLVVILNILPYSNLGVAIILVTLVVRFILYPSSKKSLEAQKKIAHIRPKLKEIEEKYKDNRQKRAEAQLALYKEQGVNPLSTLSFPLLIQLPLLIGLYRVFIVDFANSGAQEHLYSFVSYPETIGVYLLSINLSESHWLIAAIAAIAQYFQARSFAQQQMVSSKKTEDKDKKKEPDFQSSLTFSMMYVLPIVIFVFGTGIPSIGSFGGVQGLPAGVSLYWAATTLFSFWQQQRLYSQDQGEEDNEIPVSQETQHKKKTKKKKQKVRRKR